MANDRFKKLESANSATQAKHHPSSDQPRRRIELSGTRPASPRKPVQPSDVPLRTSQVPARGAQQDLLNKLIQIETTRLNHRLNVRDHADRQHDKLQSAKTKIVFGLIGIVLFFWMISRMDRVDRYYYQPTGPTRVLDILDHREYNHGYRSFQSPGRRFFKSR